MEKINYTCAYCGKECRDHRGDYTAKLRFCNMDCYTKYRNEHHKEPPKPNCKCENCGKPLYRTAKQLAKNNHVFCSLSCQSSMLMREKNKKFREDLNCTCSFCGKKFHRKKSSIGVLNFCNKSCQDEYRKSRRTVKKCLTCGKEFTVSPYKKDSAKFCSVHCHDEYQRRFFIETKCAYCGKPLRVSKTTQNHNKTGKYFCSNKCVGKYFRGENSPQYTGTSDLVKVLRTYYGLYQRPLVFERDKKVCRICGQKATNVHHIYPIYKMIDDFQKEHPDIDITKDCYHVASIFIKECGIFTDLENLISICEDCHKRQHHEERTNRWGELTFS